MGAAPSLLTDVAAELRAAGAAFTEAPARAAPREGVFPPPSFSLSPPGNFRGVEAVAWVDVIDEFGASFSETVAALHLEAGALTSPRLTSAPARSARSRLAFLATLGSRGAVLARADAAGAPVAPPVTASVGGCTITCYCVPLAARPPPPPSESLVFERRVEAVLRTRCGLDVLTEQQQKVAPPRPGDSAALTPDFLLAAPAALLGVDVVWIDAKLLTPAKAQTTKRHDKLTCTAVKYGAAFGPGMFVVDDRGDAPVPLTRFQPQATDELPAAVYVVGLSTLELGDSQGGGCATLTSSPPRAQ